MEKMIFKLSVLDKKVAFVMGNRNVDKKNLNKKKKSIVECGQLVPLIILDGKIVIDEGLIIIDVETKNEVTSAEAQNYIVIVEGQHRYMAIKELQEEDSKKQTKLAPEDIFVMYAQNGKNCSVKKLISELNSTSVIWDGKDIVAGAAMCNPTNELLKYVKELTEIKSKTKGDGLPPNGYPIATISKLLTFGSNLNKKNLTQSMDDGTDKLPTANISRGKRILECALQVGFSHKYLSHRYFIDWFMDECQLEGNSDEAVCKKVLQFTKQQVDEITKIKSEAYIYDIRQIMSPKANESQV